MSPPYMHCAAYHIQNATNKFGNIKQFSGQGTAHIVIWQLDCSTLNPMDPFNILCMSIDFTRMEKDKNPLTPS